MQFAKRSIFTLALLGSVFGFVSNVTPVHACSCLPNGSPTDAFNAAKAVFAGRAVDIDPDGMLHAVTFDVREAWKGNITTPVTVYTTDSSAACGYDFTVGQEYLVYAYEQDGELSVNLCSRTAMLADAQEDVDELNTITEAVTPGRTPFSTSLFKHTVTLWVLLVGISAFAAGYVVASKTGKKKK